MYSLHLAEELIELATPPLYPYDHPTTWSKKFVFYFGIDILNKVILVHYKLADSSSVLMAGTLVEGP